MITLKDGIEPELLQKIDRSNNIIICVPPTDHCILESKLPDILSIILTQDLNLSNATTISQNIVAIDYRPRFKMSVPSGINVTLKETNFGELTNIIDKIHKTVDLFYCRKEKSNNITTFPDYVIHENMIMTLYIDVIQMRKTINNIYLKKNQSIADIFFTWYIQTQVPLPIIENIYLIKDLYIFQEFRNII